jgi:hypothetical protein
MTTLSSQSWIRPATDADREVIERIAALDSGAPIEGPALVGELDRVPVAVVSLTDGRVVANPFRHTARLVGEMHARARRMGGVDVRPGPARRVVAAFGRRPRPAHARGWG